MSPRAFFLSSVSFALPLTAVLLLARSAAAQEPAPPATPPSGPSDPSALPALPAPTTRVTDPLPDLAPPPAAPATTSPASPAAPAAKVPDTYKPTNEQVPPPSHVQGPVYRASAGYDWRSYYGVPFRGVDVAAGMGAEFMHFAAYGEVGATFSETSADLGSRRVRVGGGVEYVEGRFRLGLGLAFTYANIDRLTGAGDNFEFTSWGIFGSASFDVVRFGATGALFVQARLNGDIFAGGSDQGLGTSWGPTLSAGFRY